MFEGEICTWGTLDGDTVTEFGATVAMATVDNAPREGEMVFPPVALARIALPSEIAQRTGIDHLGVDWEAYGHPPEPFMTSHFDFHFYTRTGEQIESIDCSNTAKPEIYPAGYVLPDFEMPGMGTLIGLCVPGMGMHAMSEADASAEALFSSSMVLGYYDQSLMFLEPMISADRLQDRTNFSGNVPQVDDQGEFLVWPKSFEAVYDKATDSYRFMFKV